MCIQKKIVHAAFDRLKGLGSLTVRKNISSQPWRISRQGVCVCVCVYVGVRGEWVGEDNDALIHTQPRCCNKKEIHVDIKRGKRIEGQQKSNI